MLDHVEMLALLFKAQDLEFVDIRADLNGVRMRLADEIMVPQVEALATAGSWIVTRSDRARVSIEPRYTKRADVPLGTALFHVSDSVNQAAILAGGLSPGAGGNTTLNRSYPPRCHLALRLDHALAFVRFQTIRATTAPMPRGVTAPPGFGLALRAPTTFDVFEIAAPDLDYHYDSHFEGGIWTETSIPASAVKLVASAEWLPLYAAIYR